MRLLFLHFFFFYVILSSGQSKDPIVIGESWTFYSEVMDEKRTLNIYLPSDYDQNDTQRYNVIYLLDGGMDEDFLHVAGLIQFLSFPWIGILPPSILVGIENIDLKRDFTFSTRIIQDQQDFPTSGRSAKFIQFIEEELLELVGKNYRTTDTTTLIGQSFGGLLATEILLNNSYLFDRYVIVSPSLWWDNQKLLNEKVYQSKKIPEVFVAVGNEGDIMIKDAEDLYNKIKNSSIAHYHYLEHQDHGDALHLAIYEAFSTFNSKEP